MANEHPHYYITDAPQDRPADGEPMDEVPIVMQQNIQHNVHNVRVENTTVNVEQPEVIPVLQEHLAGFGRDAAQWAGGVEQRLAGDMTNVIDALNFTMKRLTELEESKQQAISALRAEMDDRNRAAEAKIHLLDQQLTDSRAQNHILQQNQDLIAAQVNEELQTMKEVHYRAQDEQARLADEILGELQVAREERQYVVEEADATVQEIRKELQQRIGEQAHALGKIQVDVQKKIPELMHHNFQQTRKEWEGRLAAELNRQYHVNMATVTTQKTVPQPVEAGTSQPKQNPEQTGPCQPSGSGQISVGRLGQRSDPASIIASHTRGAAAPRGGGPPGGPGDGGDDGLPGGSGGCGGRRGETAAEMGQEMMGRDMTVHMKDRKREKSLDNPAGRTELI